MIVLPPAKNRKNWQFPAGQLPIQPGPSLIPGLEGQAGWIISKATDCVTLVPIAGDVRTEGQLNAAKSAGMDAFTFPLSVRFLLPEGFAGIIPRSQSKHQRRATPGTVSPTTPSAVDVMSYCHMLNEINGTVGPPTDPGEQRVGDGPVVRICAPFLAIRCLDSTEVGRECGTCYGKGDGIEEYRRSKGYSMNVVDEPGTAYDNLVAPQLSVSESRKLKAFYKSMQRASTPWVVPSEVIGEMQAELTTVAFEAFESKLGESTKMDVVRLVDDFIKPDVERARDDFIQGLFLQSDIKSVPAAVVKAIVEHLGTGEGYAYFTRTRLEASFRYCLPSVISPN